MKKIKKMSLYEMEQQLSQVSKAELMALLGGGEYKGVCFFDCLSSCASALGFNLDTLPMVLDYARTYYAEDHPSAYGSDGTPTDKEYWRYATEGIKHYEDRRCDIAGKYFTSVSVISTGMIETAREGGAQIILTVKGDGTDHAVVYRSYDASTDTYTVWDAAYAVEDRCKGSDIKSEVLCLFN